MPEIEVLSEMMQKALEETALANAIAEGSKRQFVSEEEIFSILESEC